MATYLLYIITNKISNKSYIGVTSTSLNRRWISHKSTAKNGRSTWKFGRAIRKYGCSDDVWERKEICFVTGIEQASLTEKSLIKEHDTYNSGYNSSRGGELYEGYTKRIKWTEERKLIMSNIHKGKSYHPGKSGSNNPRYGKPGTMLGREHSPEAKEMMSKNHHRRQEITIHGIHYHSIAAARRALGWTVYQMRKYIKDQS